MRRKAFQPPKVSDPPALVEVEWIDAQSEIEYEGPATKSGGLVLLPSAGYHVRSGRHPIHGPFVVLAREWYREDDSLEIDVRDTTTIPTGWIRSWSVVTAKTKLWPSPPEPDAK